MVPKSSEPSDIIVNSIQKIFTAQWNKMGKPTPVYYRNAPITVPTKRECITLTISKSSRFFAKLESNDSVERQLGCIIFQIFTPKDAGLLRANQIVELISPVFGVQMFTVNSDKSVTTFYNGKIEETVGAEIGGGGDPILTILFRPLETYPVGERKNYFQLNALMPFVADTLEKT